MRRGRGGQFRAPGPAGGRGDASRLSVTILTVATANGPLVFAGTIFYGGGFGSAFLGAFRSLAAQSRPGGRAGLIAAIYVAA